MRLMRAGILPTTLTGADGSEGFEYTKEASRDRAQFDQMLAIKDSKSGDYSRPEDILGKSAQLAVSPRAAQLK